MDTSSMLNAEAEEQTTSGQQLRMYEQCEAFKMYII